MKRGPFRYSRDLWEQSSDPLKYLLQLDQNVQAGVFSFYTVTVPGNNQMLERVEELKEDKLLNCFGFQTNKLTQAEEDECISWNETLLNIESLPAINIASQGAELLAN